MCMHTEVDKIKVTNLSIAIFIFKFDQEDISHYL